LRVFQAWQEVHNFNGIPITDRTFWATVYSMALGVNYGAFTVSLDWFLWHDILARKHIHVKSHDFLRVDLPIIAIAMTVGCVVLVGEVYVVRGNGPYNAGIHVNTCHCVAP
jgi:Na+/H+ antiporter NhaD/arsenite permease-like protein